MEPNYVTISTEPNLVISNSSTEILRIGPEGRIFWHGREVETDDELRAVMRELAAMMRANHA